MPLSMETSTMIKLTETQAVLLSTAAQREDGSLLPLPANLKPGGGAAKALTTLVNRGFAEERETRDVAAHFRSESDRSFGLFLTTAGATAIGVALPASEQREVVGRRTSGAASNGKVPRKTDISTRPAAPPGRWGRLPS